jgi:tetratricopeptide (TPR) repeat protein
MVHRKRNGSRRASALKALGHAWLPALVIAALAASAYFPVYRAGFVWDDDKHFTENPLMNGTGGLAGIWLENEYYYPITTSVWWAMRRIWGLNPLPYHLINVLLHAANGILLWRLLRRLGAPAAWLAATAWTLHPVNVQSVAWAVGSTAWLARERLTATAFRRFGIGAGGMTIAALGLLTAQQSTVYRAEETLWLAVLETNPSAWIAHNNLAQLASKRGDHEAALERLQRALELTQSEKGAELIRFNQALVLSKLGMNEAALAEFRRLQQTRGRMEIRLARTLERLGRDAEAEEQYRLALAGEDRDDALVIFGAHLIRRGRPEEAIRHLGEFVEMHPGDVDGRMFLCDALAAAGPATPA